MEEREKLPIPVNVVEQEDFISGFGNKEILITALVFVIGVILGGIIFVGTGNMIIAIGLASVLLAATILIIKRDRFDESMIDKVRFVRIYINAQKQYMYSYYNIYEGRIEDGNAGTETDGKRIYKRQRH